MTFFEDLGAGEKKKLAVIWKSMGPSDKEHFINQAALALSILGSDEKGKRILVELIMNLVEDGSKNLADLGLYPEFLEESKVRGREDKFKKAQGVLENYRFKHDLPSEPSKDFLV